VPPDAARHVTERPPYIEPCYLPSDAARRPSADEVTRATYRLPADATVFAAMTAAYKIMPEHFDAMLDVLQGVPGAVLWLRDQPSTVVKRYELAAAARGVPADRLICAPNEPVPRYLKRFALADLFLDTMPFGLKRLRTYLRERDVGRLTIKKRGTAVVPEQLRRQLDLRGNAFATIILTRVAGSQQVLVVEAA